MSERVSWQSVRDRRMESAQAQHAYEAARRAHEFGATIRAAREAKGLTQTELGRRISTSQSAVARLEAGGVQPSLETMSRLSVALGVRLVVDATGVSSEPAAAIS
jgi:ribosome-binding protein aMBF1 (putative translation factor)